LWRGANCEIARATFSSLCAHRIALVAVRCEFSGRPRNLNRHFVHIGSLSLWRGENCEIARATFSSLCAHRIALVVAWCEFSGRPRNLLVTLCAPDRSHCGAVRIVRSLAQPSRHVVRIGSLSLRREFSGRPRNLLVTLCASDRSRRGVVRIFDHPRNLLVTLRASVRSRCGLRVLILHACSCKLLGALGLSDRSCYGAVLMLMVKEILCRDLDKEVFYRELVQRSCRAMSCRDLVQRSCQETSSRDLVQLRPCMDICWDHAKSLLV